MKLLAAKSETMGWDELARALFQGLLEEHDPLIAAVVFHGLVSTLILLVGGFYVAYLLRKKDNEIKRMAERDQRLVDMILQNRISSTDKKHKAK